MKRRAHWDLQHYLDLYFEECLSFYVYFKKYINLQSCKAVACSKSVSPVGVEAPSSSSRRGGKGAFEDFLLLLGRTVLENLRVKLAPVTPIALFLKLSPPLLLNQVPSGEVKQIAQIN